MNRTTVDLHSNGVSPRRSAPPSPPLPAVATCWASQSSAWAAGAGGGIGEPISTLVMAPLVGGRFQVWALTSQQTLWTCWHTGAETAAPWSAWEPFSPGPGPVQQVALGQFPDGRLFLWVVDLAGQVLTCWQTEAASAAPWSAWQRFAPIVELIPQPDPGGAWGEDG